MFKFLISIFKTDPGKKILKERDELYKKSVTLQRNGDLREYGKVMKRIEELEKEYDQIMNKNKPQSGESSYADHDVIDYDGMGNQGRFPKVKNKNSTKMKRLIGKILLWWSYKWPKKNKRKSIWEL